MSKPKMKKNIVETTRKPNAVPGDVPPPFDTHDNDKIGRVNSKERT